MATIGTAAADALGHKAKGEHETQLGARQAVPLADAEAIIATWPAAPKKGAKQMLEQYGPPNEATPTKLYDHAQPHARDRDR